MYCLNQSLLWVRMLEFDLNIMACELLQGKHNFKIIRVTCSRYLYRTDGSYFVRLPGGRGGKFKLPTLTELYQHLFGKAFKDAHNATADVEATTRCFLELVRRREFTHRAIRCSARLF